MKKAWLVGLSAVVFSAIGCGAGSVEGEWEHEEASGEYHDEMTLEEDGYGYREVSFPMGVGCGDDFVTAEVTIEADVDWRERGEDRYELDFSCSFAQITAPGCESITGCSNVESFLEASMDFEVDCDYLADYEELECEYSDGSEFVFERR